MTVDNDKFKNLVAEFQSGENKTIIDKIIDYMFIRFDLVNTDNMPEYAMYIAFKINVILAPLLKTAKYNVDRGSYDPEDLLWYAKGLREDLGIEMTADDGFKAVFDNLPAIERMYGYDVAGRLVYSVHRYLTQGAAIDYEIERIIVSVEPLIRGALETALSKVDISRSEREIVRYINRVFQTEYYRLQTEVSGTKRLGRRDKDGNFVNVYVQPTDTPIWDVVLGVSTAGMDVTKAISELTELQRSTILDMHDIVYDDFEREDFSAYKINEKGQYEITNRRMAQELGIDETTLRKRRSNIKQVLTKVS